MRVAGASLAQAAQEAFQVSPCRHSRCYTPPQALTAGSTRTARRPLPLSSLNFSISSSSSSPLPLLTSTTHQRHFLTTTTTSSTSSVTVRNLKSSFLPSRHLLRRQQSHQPTQRRWCSHFRSRDTPPFGANASMDATKGRQILPANVKPTHYNVTLEPNFDDFTYNGSVDIDVDVVEDSTSISHNTNDIEIQSTSLKVDGASVEVAAEVAYNEDTQTTKVNLGPVLKAGQKATLSHRFTGKLNDVMAGFYRSSWKDKDGKEHFIASSQMEPTDARRAFPCFDEPALKATFTITLIADHELTCLSNMDVAKEVEVDSQQAGKKRKAVIFNKTPLMSTYLVAFIVGDLRYCETNKFRIPIRTYCTPDQDPEHGMYAAELAARTLEFYEKEFGIEYPLPKIDQIGVPDYAAGAMENWGLVTYRTRLVLLDEKTCSAADKRQVAETIAHELAHQWFGNLVTMDFWEGLWLKEGFATWMSWYACNAFYPDWKVWDGHVIESLGSALSLDSLRSSHPIEVPVKRADEVNQIFDAISYEKGSCVIRMVSKYLGEDVFMEGIRKYLKKHAYANTVTDDLWAALSEASGKDVEKIAAIWTRDIGYPVVTVSEDKQNNIIHLKQNRFLRTADVKPEEDKVIYPVPLRIQTKNGVDGDSSLSKREDSFTLPDLDFYKLNAEHSGIYRTMYPSERLQKLGQDARNGLLPVSDRAGMIADAGALAQAGYQKTSGLLALLQSFDFEPDYEVWRMINSRVATLKTAWRFESEESRNGIREFHRALVTKRAHQIGWNFGPQDGHVEQQFKALMFSAACSVDDEKALAAARDMFTKFINGDRDALHQNIRRTVFSTVIRTGGKAEYDAVVKEQQTANLSSERNQALAGLGASRDPELIQRSLEYTMSEHVKSQDLYYPISALTGHAEGIEACWKWLTSNWEPLCVKLPPSLSMLGRVIQMIVTGFTKEEQRKTVEAFFADKDLKGIEMDIAQALDVVRSKEGWLSRDKADVESYLKEHKFM